MNLTHPPQQGLKIPVMLVLASSIAVISACSDNNGPATVQPTAIISANIPASTGGTFTDNADNPKVRLFVPAGALSEDATLKVVVNDRPPEVGENQTAGSDVGYDITLEPADGSGDLKLTTPMRMEFKTDQAPVHPQIAEVGAYVDGQWVRMPANFYRASDSTTLALSRRTHNTFRVVHRTLQTEKDTAAVARGKDLYFNSTYGNEKFFGDLYGLPVLLAALPPSAAVQAGVQIDINKVPKPIVDVMLSDDFATKRASLDDPATTLALLKADAVVGVKAKFEDPGDPDKITTAGLNCTICHVAVKPTEFQLEVGADPVPLPIGQPVLGPPNTKINPGFILSLTPLVQSGSENQFIDQYQSWGPGRADPRFFPGNPFNDLVFNPTSIPPHWNFIDLGEQGYTYTWQGVVQGKGKGSNNLAAAPECGIDFVMNANGAWGTPNATIQLKEDDIANPLTADQSQRFIDAEAQEPGNEIDIATLTDLQAFLRSIVSPAPGKFDEAKAEEGWDLFYGKANCNACHFSGEGTGARQFFLHIAQDTNPGGLLDNGIKTPGLRGLALTAPYFHDGSAATLRDVMARYSSGVDAVPVLTASEQEALVEYMKSL